MRKSLDLVVRRTLRAWEAERDNARHAERDFEDLREYLGDAFDEARLAHSNQAVDAEAAAAPDELTFYRTSEAYLYNLTTFASSRAKVPYRMAVRRVVPKGSQLLDYGCGIGCDGLRLWDEGYHVDFTDFENPSLRFLRWRLERHGIRDARVLDVESDIDRRYDLAYSFDVIEHLDDPRAFLERMESLANLVAVNFLELHPYDVGVHHELPIRELLGHAQRCGLLHYRLHYGRSHFVIYRSPSSGTSPSRGGDLTSAIRRRAGFALGRAYRLRAGIERRLGAAVDHL